MFRLIGVPVLLALALSVATPQTLHAAEGGKVTWTGKQDNAKEKEQLDLERGSRARDRDAVNGDVAVAGDGNDVALETISRSATSTRRRPEGAASRTRVDGLIPDRSGLTTPNTGERPDSNNERDKDDDELGAGDRLKNGYTGFQTLMTSIVTLAAGLSALTAENGSFLGRTFGALKTVSGLMGLAYGGDSLLSALTGKYFMPDSMRKWGKVAAFVNHGVAMMEVTKLAFGKLGDVWNRITGKKKKEDLPAVQAQGVTNNVQNMYVFNCGAGGRCYLPTGGAAAAPITTADIMQASPITSPVEAFVAACHSRYQAGPVPIWWDQAVCRADAVPAGATPAQAAALGDQLGLEALQKGDAYWAACRAQAPDADLNGSFYYNACGNRWITDAPSGQFVPAWMQARDWQAARELGTQHGKAAR